MNKRSRKVRGSSRRLVALVLCCVCVLAALPVYALANEAATTPSTEASVQQTAGQAPDTPAQGTDTQSADAAPNPAADVNPSNSTPAADETPSNSTPADETPGNSTPADETPGNSTPADETPSNSTPADETPSNSTPADETPSGSTLADENPTEGSTQPEASARRTVTATAADGLEFSVIGDLPETTTLRVEKLRSEAEAFIRDTVLQLGDQATGAAYDITLLDNDKEIQPEGEVEVSINGLTSAQGVYHLPHTSAADVVKLVEEVAAQAEENGITEFFSKMVKVATKAGKSTPIPTSEKMTFHLSQDKLKFKTSGFSTYYVVFSDPENNEAGNGLATNNDTVYMAPGATLKYDYTWPNNSDLSDPTVSPADGSVTAQKQGNSIVISAAPNATNSGPYTVEWKQGEDKYLGNYQYSYATKYKLTVYVNQEEAIEWHLNGQKLYIAVRDNGYAAGEPADQSQSSAGYGYYYNDGYSFNHGAQKYFTDNAADYISANIGAHKDFTQSATDGHTVGIYDASGTEIFGVIDEEEIDFGKFLAAIADNGQVKASDGQYVTKENIDDYEIIPYVVKYQAENGVGWHIDCFVRCKESFTLQYRLNIPNGYQAGEKVGIPDPQTGPSGTKFNIGAVKDNGKIVTKITVTPTEANTDKRERELTFLGWNTSPDGNGTWYWPKDLESSAGGKPVEITITENTTLYAIWKPNIEFGTGNLKIEKKVADTTTQTFTFKVEIAMPEGKTEPEGAKYSYVVYNSTSNTEAGTSSTITNGGTLDLADGQYAVIKGLPSGASVTVTETVTGGYTPTWTGGTPSGNGVTTTIPDGSEKTVTCTNNTRTATLTIKKTLSGNMYNGNDKFDFSVTINGTVETFSLGNNGTKTFSVPVGASVKVTETPGDYTYSCTSIKTGTTDVAKTDLTDEKGFSFTMPSGDVEVVINNDKTASIDTGVLLDTLPYLLILALVAGGVVVMLGRRRRRYED